jgi:hypothetical protein
MEFLLACKRTLRLLFETVVHRVLGRHQAKRRNRIIEGFQHCSYAIEKIERETRTSLRLHIRLVIMAGRVFILDRLMAGYGKPENLLGEYGLFKQLQRRHFERV